MCLPVRQRGHLFPALNSRTKVKLPIGWLQSPNTAHTQTFVHLYRNLVQILKYLYIFLPLGEGRVIYFLTAEYPQRGKSMSIQTPMSELAERILSKTVREASHAATLDQHLRSQNCVTAPVLASILGCSADTIHRRRRTQGLPAHFDGARWKFFGPEVADWQSDRDRQQGLPQKHRISCREAAPPTGGPK